MVLVGVLVSAACWAAFGHAHDGKNIPEYLDDRQITYLLCVRVKHLLYDF